METNNAIDHHADDDEISSRGLLFLGLCMVLGFASHRARPMIKALGPAWSDLTSYSLGVVLIISVFPTIYSTVLESANGGALTRKRAVFLAFISLVLAAGTIGSGVVAAWLVDPDAGPVEDEM